MRVQPWRQREETAAGWAPLHNLLLQQSLNPSSADWQSLWQISSEQRRSACVTLQPFLPLSTSHPAPFSVILSLLTLPHPLVCCFPPLFHAHIATGKPLRADNSSFISIKHPIIPALPGDKERMAYTCAHWASQLSQILSHTSMENHLGMSRSDWGGAGWEAVVDKSLGGRRKRERKKNRARTTWPRSPICCHRTRINSADVLWALKGPAAEEIVQWGRKYGWQKLLCSPGLGRDWGFNSDDHHCRSSFFLII